MRFNVDNLAVALLLLSSTPSLAHSQPGSDIRLPPRDESTALDARDKSFFANVNIFAKRSEETGSSGSTGHSGSSGSTSIEYVRSVGSVSRERERGARKRSTASKIPGRIVMNLRHGIREMAVPISAKKRRTICTVTGKFQSPPLFIRWQQQTEAKSDKYSSSTKGSTTKGSTTKGPKPKNPTTKGGSSSTDEEPSSSGAENSPSSSKGGATKQGSGVQPTFGGGRFYGGGSTSPYAAGVRSPRGITPTFIRATFLTIYSHFWAQGAYSYRYTHRYTFVNHSVVTNSSQGVNQTKPVICLCALYGECGCDDNGNTTFLDSLIRNGSYASLNKTLLDVADINGTSTILLNGTLPNGTTVNGGTENATAAVRKMPEASGWALIALVGCTVLLI